MSEPSTTSSNPGPSARHDHGGERAGPAPAPEAAGRTASGGHGSGGLTRATRERRELDEAENDLRDLMHRVLIASPWQRYQMDRDAAEPAPAGPTPEREVEVAPESSAL